MYTTSSTPSRGTKYGKRMEHTEAVQGGIWGMAPKVGGGGLGGQTVPLLELKPYK